MIMDMAGHYHVLKSPSGSVVTNGFQQVAVTYDKSTGAGLLYLNSQVVAQAQWQTFAPKTEGDLWISYRPGAHPNDPTYNTFFAGLLDEIAIYNRALTTKEIQDYYHTMTAGKSVAHH